MEKVSKKCRAGHTFYKSSDCPVCPECEKIKAEKAHPFHFLSAPARRALDNNEIHSLEDLGRYTESQILSLHGMGPASIPLLRKAFQNSGFEPMSTE